MPTSFQVQLFFQCLLNQLFGVGIGFGQLGPQGTGEEGNEYQDADGNADGIIQSGSFGKGWTKKGISMHREDTSISLSNQGYLD